VITTFKLSLPAGRMALRLLAVAAWLVLALLPLRAEPIGVGFDTAHIDLLPLARKVEEISPAATLELPATGAAPASTVALNARGPGPLYRWAVFTLNNPDAQARHMVIAAPHQRFVASQVLWPRPEGSRVIGLVTADGLAVAPLPSLGVDAFALTLPPGATASYALEVSTTGLDTLSLWHRGAFHVVADRYAFFRGLVLGISILLGIGFVCLFIVRPQSIFPAAALFGWSAIGFLMIETGYLPTVLARFPGLAGSEQSLRAFAEGLMLAGAIAMLASFLELRRWMPRLAMGLMAGGAAAGALAFYGLFDPRTAIGLIRIAFALVVAGGLGVMLVLWRRGAARAQAALLGWLVLTGWTVAAGAGALGLFDPALMHPLLSAGLVLVLLTIAFTLAQLAFGLGAPSGAAVEEGSRRALALAASDQAVWDWQVDQGKLHVGPEIERALGLEAGALGEDAARWLELVHPADRAAYGAAVEAAERRGRGSFSQEFRLRRADGSYRWYVLRARALPGGHGGASRLIGTLADVTAIRRSEDRLLADAVRDRLTGLPNRALFLDRLEQAMTRDRDWADAELYIIALDLDRFKSFNDGLGVEAGDYLLQTTGRRLLACVGPAVTVARLPGHQFGILWDASRHASGIAELVGAMSASVSQPIHLPAGEVVLTASMGVALVHGEYRGAETVLKHAEIALYEAKRQGYGAVEYFRSDMHDERSQLLQLEQNLRHALERNEIEVVYQPIVSLADRKLAGFEALMRWRRGDSVLEPDSFVGLAEETGIIRELSRHVLKEAASRLGTWQRAFRPHDSLFVAVNISSVQLLNNDLVEDIGRLMEREDLRPGTLKLELTESLVVENPELARKLLVRLKQMGVALACDDFGTGYSGLESVFRLPFDTVKLDRVFLEAENGERNWEMVEAMLRLARDLGLDVVAEGIETDEQMERLSRLGCDYGQGYLIGPPVTAQQVIAALGGHSHEAAGLGTGLAAFWNRLTGAGEAEADRVAAQNRPLPEIPAAGPEPVEAPEVSEDIEDEPVIDVRAIVPPARKPPARKPPARKPPASKPPAPDVPAVGSAPFAPRRVRTPEPELLEISFSDLMLPRIATPEAEAEHSEEAPPSEPEQVEVEEIQVAPPPEAKRGKRKKPKANQAVGASSPRRKGRRAAKPAPAKATAAKGKTKGAAARNKRAGKSASAKRGQAKPAPAKQH
jgi:diguanylate cyclase (GGDEF)-like protein/PAS domain S-box-containing protein